MTWVLQVRIKNRTTCPPSQEWHSGRQPIQTPVTEYHDGSRSWHHGAAEKDFKNQILYTTHSPFMVPTHALETIRTVARSAQRTPLKTTGGAR